MQTVDDILLAAAQRAVAKGLAFAGELTPTEANALLNEDTRSVMVDVRTAAEWQFVGGVPGAICIEWKMFPGMVNNVEFASLLQARVEKHARVLFLCRTGARSQEAALLAQSLGYNEAYNILEGFEGDRNDEGHRSTLNGWKFAKLPWQQG